jgi:hypothetical protein
MFLLSTPAYAGPIDIMGDKSNISLHLKDAKLKDVLSALGKKYGIEVQCNQCSEIKSGEYFGSVEKVISKLMENKSFVIHQGKVTGLDSGKPTPTIVAPKVVVAKKFLDAYLLRASRSKARKESVEMLWPQR